MEPIKVFTEVTCQTYINTVNRANIYFGGTLSNDCIFQFGRTVERLISRIVVIHSEGKFPSTYV